MKKIILVRTFRSGMESFATREIIGEIASDYPFTPPGGKLEISQPPTWKPAYQVVGAGFIHSTETLVSALSLQTALEMLDPPVETRVIDWEGTEVE